MSQSYDPEELEKLLPRERQFVDSIEDDAKRNAVACSILQHRVPDTLSVGDALPDLKLANLKGDDISLRSFIGDRPLLLAFGSYT